MENIIPKLRVAKAYSGCKLYLEFFDGVTGMIDLSKWKEKPVFSKWNDEENFKNFKITEDRKIEWGGNIDMDPDAFYLELINKTFSEYAGDQQFLRYSN